MSESTSEHPVHQTLEQIIDSQDGWDRDTLIAALRVREDHIKDDLMLMAQRLGSEPRLVAGVLMHVGLGTPPDETTAAFIEANYRDGLAWLEDLIRQQMGGQAPE